MDEIKPLLESSSNPLTRDLLRSALPDAPQPRAMGRAAAALGVTLTTATAAASVSSSAATVISAANGTSMVAKWLVVGMASGGLVAGGASLLDAREPAPSASPRATAPVAHLPQVLKQATAHAPLAEPEGAATAERPAEPRARLAPQEARPSPLFRKESGKLSREVELIDGARKAVAASNAALALAELDRYARVRETGTLDREARLLRIDALVLRGDRPRASELARLYLQDFPNDPHAARLREISTKVNEP